MLELMFLPIQLGVTLNFTIMFIDHIYTIALHFYMLFVIYHGFTFLQILLLIQPQIFTLIPFFEILHMLCKFLNVSIDFIFIWNHFKKYTNPISTYRNIKITWLDSMTKILEIRIQTLVLHLCDEFIIVCHSYPIKKNMNYK
jgi:hypothetical protein